MRSNYCKEQGMLTKMLLAVLPVVLLVSLTGCKNDASTEQDILTQKVIKPDRIPITVLVKYAFAINNFEKVVEEKFPEIDIVQVGNYTRDMGIVEYETRLRNDDLTDVMMTWPLDVGEKYWKDRLIDLSGMDFTNRYNLSMLNEISRDGELYYLPGPSQVRGIVYNKTLFQENGWKMPTDFESFIALCKQIEASGIRSIQLGFENGEVLDTAFIGYNYGNYFSKPQQIQWLDDYNEGKGTFGEQFSPALDVFQRMIDEGIWKETDLDVDYSERENMLFTRKAAMVEDSILMARMGFSQTGTTDEYGLMPFFNPGVENDWARLYMVCYIGLNKHLLESENEEKYKLVLKLMDYISTEEGQEVLASDTEAMFSSLKGMPLPEIPEIEHVASALNHGRYANFPKLDRAQQALRKGLAGMLKGEISKEEVNKMVDYANLHPEEEEPPAILGKATENFTIVETGNFVTDAMRAWSDSDFALFLDNGKDGKYNGKGISARLYKGDVTNQDIQRILPDLKIGNSGTLWNIKITGKNLLKALEYSLPVNNNETGWFYYFSGLTMEYDPVAKPGSRIKKITTDNGQSIKPDKLYSVAVMDQTIFDKYVQSIEKTDTYISMILAEKISTEKYISPSKDGRFSIYTK